MCRFMAYLGTPCLLADLVTKPSRSLTRQSYDAKERLTGHGYLNGDGFGIGWYSPEARQHGDPTPCMFSSIQPAWNNRNLERLANKIVSPLIFAHVRAAYPGIPVSDSNCQPFVCGRYLWMHNGGVGGFNLVRRRLLDTLRDDVYEQCPSFESDSGICFALFLNNIDDVMIELPPEELVAKMNATIDLINRICSEAGLGQEESLLNFVVSDGKTVVSTRYTNIVGEPGASLYYASGSKFECVDRKSNEYFVKHSDRRGLLGIVASEPLTDESADWIQVPRNTMVVMTRFKGEFVDLILVPIGAPPAVQRDISRSFKALASCSSTSLKVSLKKEPGASLPPADVPLVTSPRHTMTGHGSPVLALAVYGKKVVSGSQEGVIRLYDLKEFRCVKELNGHSQTIFSLNVHNGLLYSSSTRVVKIWDMASFKLLSKLSHSDGDVFALALAQGRAVAGPAGTSIIRCNRRGVTTKEVVARGAERTGHSSGASSSSAPLQGDSTEVPDIAAKISRENGDCVLQSSTDASQTASGSGRIQGSHSLAQVVRVDQEHESTQRFLSLILPVSAEGTVLPNGHEETPVLDSLERWNSAKIHPLLEKVGAMTIPLREREAFFNEAGAQLVLAEPSTSNGEGQRSSGTSPLRPRWLPESSCTSTEPTLVLTDTERMGHCSRVYALVMCNPFLCSGAGDGFVKVWSLATACCVATLYGHKGGVMALAAIQEAERSDGRLLSGSRDNTIRVWDLATLSCITTITGHSDDVLGLAIGSREEFYSASVDQTVRMWSLVTYECLRIFLHEGSNFLSIACTADGVLTGSSDGLVRYWEVGVTDITSCTGPPTPKTIRSQCTSGSREEHALMEEKLRKFVRIRTFSTDKSKSAQDRAWKGAKYLMGLLEDLGAEAKLVVTVENTNPVVFGRIVQDPSKLTVAICGHYDVAEVAEDKWTTDPFDVTAIDGYLHGRGVSDSKGPLVASIFAVKELVTSGELKANVIFIIDGMQESGSQGFREAVQANLEWFEGTGFILSASGSWFNDEYPCLTYGMRGLICLEVEVDGPAKDLHSGTDGGAFSEPMNDLVTVLSHLVDSNNMILIPGFYDDVKPLDDEEAALYEELSFQLEDYKVASGLRALAASSPKDVLLNRWRNPSLSITGIDSAAHGWSVIPRSCTARVCIRHVPDQNPERLVDKFRGHINHEFAKLRSVGNKINVRVAHVGDWWLADPNCHFYKTAEKAIEKQWGMRPMYVREGGTLPVLPFLEKVLGAPALQLPISQATDHSAPQNERLRWMNFVRGKEVIRDLLYALGTS
eukprot:SM000010S04337  [mRNA]  locus=s10:1062363:1070596:- [translate_table: standard]